jgi:hypothetical protein
MHYFVARGLRPPVAGDAEVQPDEDEDIEVRPFATAELRQMIASGDLVDLKTLAGLALLDRLVPGY